MNMRFGAKQCPDLFGFKESEPSPLTRVDAGNGRFRLSRGSVRYRLHFGRLLDLVLTSPTSSP